MICGKCLRTLIHTHFLSLYCYFSSFWSTIIGIFLEECSNTLRGFVPKYSFMFFFVLLLFFFIVILKYLIILETLLKYLLPSAIEFFIAQDIKEHKQCIIPLGKLCCQIALCSLHTRVEFLCNSHYFALFSVPKLSTNKYGL